MRAFGVIGMEREREIVIVSVCERPSDSYSILIQQNKKKVDVL